MQPVTSRTFWVLAKYIPDFRRAEVHNVGVILSHKGAYYSRFTEAHQPLIKEPSIYKAWIAYWENELKSVILSDLVERWQRTQTSSYFLEFSGQRIEGPEIEEPQAFLDQLFAELVESPKALSSEVWKWFSSLSRAERKDVLAVLHDSRKLCKDQERKVLLETLIHKLETDHAALKERL